MTGAITIEHIKLFLSFGGGIVAAMLYLFKIKMGIEAKLSAQISEMKEKHHALEMKLAQEFITKMEFNAFREEFREGQKRLFERLDKLLEKQSS